MSYKAEVIADSSGKWAGNGLYFKTAEEANAYVTDLAFRWISVKATRVVESKEPVTHHYSDDRGLYEVKS